MPSLTLNSSGDGLPVTLRVGRQFFGRVAAYVNRAQVKRVEKQKTIDGMGIRDNSRKTQQVKARRGQPQLSLIDGWRTSGIKWKKAGQGSGKLGKTVAFYTRKEVSRSMAWRRNVTASWGYKWRSAGRSGGRIRTEEQTFIHTVKGKQTREHHFVGPRALRQQASDVSAVVWLPSESSAILGHLEKQGYVRTWGFADGDRKGINAMWIATLRGLIRARAKALRG